MVTRVEGEGDGVSFEVDGNVLELDNGGGCSTLNILKTTD